MRKPTKETINYFAKTTFHAKREAFGIYRADRFFHMHIVGQTGTGKSTLIESLIRQDIAFGEGCCLIDPHGDLAQRVIRAVPPSRKDDLVFLDVAADEPAWGYNPLRRVHRRYRPLAAAGLIEVFKKLSDNRSWGPRMEHILRNCLLVLFDQEEATLSDVLRLLTDKDYRRAAVRDAENPEVRRFFRTEYEKYTSRLRADAIAPVQNKVGAFLADPKLAAIVTSGAERAIRIREIMDSGKILVVSLARGQIGESTAALLGGLLVTTLGLAAFSRANVGPAHRRPFWVYVDEFQSFTTLAVANMLSELRKYGVGMVVAHQYLSQLEAEIRDAVLGNAGTTVAFRVGAADAGFLERMFEPTFRSVDFLRLPNRRIYLKLMIDGSPSVPFSAETLDPSYATKARLAHCWRISGRQGSASSGLEVENPKALGGSPI